jgi:hypothetical protein
LVPPIDLRALKALPKKGSRRSLVGKRRPRGGRGVLILDVLDENSRDRTGLHLDRSTWKTDHAVFDYSILQGNEGMRLYDLV